MRGLTDKSKLVEEVIKQDENTAIRYRVVEQKIDLKALREEKEVLEKELNSKEPTQEELLRWARDTYPLAKDKETLQSEIDAIESILATVN